MFALAGLGLSGLKSLSKKWTDQCQSEEKKVIVESNIFPRKEKAPNKNRVER